jgi:hypothetical protein
MGISPEQIIVKLSSCYVTATLFIKRNTMRKIMEYSDSEMGWLFFLLIRLRGTSMTDLKDGDVIESQKGFACCYCLW